MTKFVRGLLFGLPLGMALVSKLAKKATPLSHQEWELPVADDAPEAGIHLSSLMLELDAKFAQDPIIRRYQKRWDIRFHRREYGGEWLIPHPQDDKQRAYQVLQVIARKTLVSVIRRECTAGEWKDMERITVSFRSGSMRTYRNGKQFARKNLKKELENLIESAYYLRSPKYVQTEKGWRRERVGVRCGRAKRWLISDLNNVLKGEIKRIEKFAKSVSRETLSTIEGVAKGPEGVMTNAERKELREQMKRDRELPEISSDWDEWNADDLEIPTDLQLNWEPDPRPVEQDRAIIVRTSDERWFRVETKPTCSALRGFCGVFRLEDGTIIESHNTWELQPSLTYLVGEQAPMTNFDGDVRRGELLRDILYTGLSWGGMSYMFGKPPVGPKGIESELYPNRLFGKDVTDVRPVCPMTFVLWKYDC